MERNKPFDDTIENLQKTVDSVDEATKDKESKQDDENKDPAYVFYNAIANTSVELLQNPNVVDTFKKLANSLGEDVTKSLIEMFAIMLTQSAYNAVIFYDSLLKSELAKQFNHFAEHLNMAKADINAHKGALKVFRQQLGDIQTKLKIEKFQEENKVTVDPNNH